MEQQQLEVLVQHGVGVASQPRMGVDLHWE